MTLQLFCLPLLAAVVFSSTDPCVPYGPAIGGVCPAKEMTIKYGLGQAIDPFHVGICVKCPSSDTSSVPQGCTLIGPAIGNSCPSPTMSIKHGLGLDVDPFTVGICIKCDEKL